MSNILIDGDGLYGQDLAVLRVVFSGIDSKNERERERERERDLGETLMLHV